MRYSFTYIFNSKLPVFKYFSTLTNVKVRAPGPSIIDQAGQDIADVAAGAQAGGGGGAAGRRRPGTQGF